MRPIIQWLMIAAMLAGYFLPASSVPVFSSRPPAPEVQNAHSDLSLPGRTSVFDARQFVRGAVDDARITPCLLPTFDSAILSFASADPIGETDQPAARQTLLALHVRMQP